MWFWKPILADNGVTIDITTLTNDEVMELNHAMEIYAEMVERERQKKKNQKASK
ncbi:hypothetical protein [Gracilibacillus oryzae]|uniref:hypothetical protein n=1 Tax=Gracilibacillus oryzae TaxID=1672701 RepID=UPI00129556FF|nr:hypothetical protein [Gracilibacillus oryzae]